MKSRVDAVDADTSDEPILRGHFRQQLTARILTGVFQGRFRSGQRLIVQHLTKLYGVSPTPVRESLLELAGLGILQLLPNRGAVVRPFGRQEVREISQIRRILEVEATRTACGQISPDALAEIEDELVGLQPTHPGRKWEVAARGADTRFHALIAASCGSTRLIAEIERYTTLWRTLRNVSQRLDLVSNPANQTLSVAEHLAVVRALRAGDAEAASQCMDCHIRSTLRILEDVLFSQADRSDTEPAGAGS